jgi:hypothetical protein
MPPLFSEGGDKMADQLLRQVAFDVARLIAGLTAVTDSAGNLAVPKAELIAELAVYFQDSVTATLFTEQAYEPVSG